MGSFSFHWVGATSCLAAVLLLGACQPPVPSDFSSLMELMNSESETTSVAASNKVAEVYGKAGLLEVLEEGKPTARAMAARWLVRFPNKEVEAALAEVVAREELPYIRIRALWTLKDIGTRLSLPAIERAAQDKDGSVAIMARDAASAIRMRSQ